MCSEMLVQWVTRDSHKPVVRWGKSADRLTHEASARTFTYTRSDMCGGVAAGVSACTRVFVCVQMCRAFL